jgi:hypothetical protein
VSERLELKQWWTAQELLSLPGMPGTVQGINKRAWREQWFDRERQGRGGGREYRFDCLPRETQTFLIQRHAEAQKADEPNMSEIISNIETDMNVYASAPAWAREHADKILLVLSASSTFKGEDLKLFVKSWNESHPEMQVSDKSIYRWRKDVAEYGKMAVMPKWGKRNGSTTILDEWFEYFTQNFLQQSRSSVKSVWIETLGFVKRQNKEISQENFPSPMAFRRLLEKRFSESDIYLGRYGWKEWTQKYGHHLIRDYSNLKAGEVWVSDHAQIDVLTKHGDNKMAAPWYTAWRDVKTGKHLGWVFHIEPPNSDHIFQAFFNAAVKYGLPTDVVIDNGKDYRCRDFAGGRSVSTTFIKVEINKEKAAPMLSRLNIIPHFAWPFNAQAKPIERDFLKIKNELSKRFPGYRGGDVIERPAEKLKAEIKKDLIRPFEDFAKEYEDFIETIFNELPSEGKALQGRSPNQAWKEEFTVKREVRKEALMLFCMRCSKMKTIRGNGVEVAEIGGRYWAEWMAGYMGERVYYRHPPDEYQSVWFFAEKGDAYLGDGKFCKNNEFMARTEEAQDSLREAIAVKRRAEKAQREKLKHLKPTEATERLDNLRAGVAAIQKPLPSENEPEKPVVSQIMNTNMDQVIIQKKRMENEGKVDFTAPSKIILFPQKQKFYTSTVEKERDEERARESRKNS